MFHDMEQRFVLYFLIPTGRKNRAYAQPLHAKGSVTSTSAHPLIFIARFSPDAGRGDLVAQYFST
jgi:hypothetical protein